MSAIQQSRRCISRICLLVICFAVLLTADAHIEQSKGIERRTMADAFHEHNQVNAQRRMRLGGTRTRTGRGEMRTTGQRRGGGRNRNNEGMSVKTRGGRTRTGGNRNADGVRIGKRGKNADGTSRPARNGNRGGGRGAENGSVRVRGGNDGKERPGTPRTKTRNGESMARAVVKAGINLVPLENTKNKGKRKHGN